MSGWYGGTANASQREVGTGKAVPQLRLHTSETSTARDVGSRMLEIWCLPDSVWGTSDRELPTMFILKGEETS